MKNAFAPADSSPGARPSFNPGHPYRPTDSPVMIHSERVPLSKPKHYPSEYTRHQVHNSLPRGAATGGRPLVWLRHRPGPFLPESPRVGSMGWHLRNSRVRSRLARHGSLRVPFRVGVRAKAATTFGPRKRSRVFSVESPEEWRERAGLEKMAPIGHSLCAYFSAVYALQYPERVRRFISLYPAGVPHDPNNTIPSREMLDRQVTGEDGPEVADSSRLAALELEQPERAEKRKESFGCRLLTHL